MKNIVLSLGIAIATLSVHANPISNLTVELEKEGNFMVVVNGKKQLGHSNTFRFAHLHPGIYPIQVLRANYWGSPAVLFSGTVRIPASTNVDAILDHHNQLKVRFTPIQQNSGFGFVSHAGQQGYHQGPDPIVCSSPTPPFNFGMSQYAFVRTLDIMSDSPFDGDKLLVARQAIRSHGVNSEQVLKLMNALTFESSKLKLAKFAFDHVADSQNYFMVNQGFTFSSSIRELDRFING